MRSQVNVKYFRDEVPAGLEVAWVNASPHDFPSHTHDHYAIAVMQNGANYCIPRQRSLVVESGQVALINPGLVHTGNPVRGVPSTYCMFYVEQDFVRRLLREQNLDRDGEFTQVVAEAPQAHGLLLRLSRALALRAGPLATESLLVSAMTRLFNRYGAKPGAPLPALREPAAVARAKSVLDQNLDRRVSLTQLSQQVGLSRYHLLRTFKAATGISPHVYHLQVRLDGAKRLLRSGSSIAQAAAASGFSDQSHFTNTFRRYTGATPAQYAKGAKI